MRKSSRNSPQIIAGARLTFASCRSPSEITLVRWPTGRTPLPRRQQRLDVARARLSLNSLVPTRLSEFCISGARRPRRVSLYLTYGRGNCSPNVEGVGRGRSPGSRGSPARSESPAPNGPSPNRGARRDGSRSSLPHAVRPIARARCRCRRARGPADGGPAYRIVRSAAPCRGRRSARHWRRNLVTGP
jgi:hypothetical protein